VVAGYTARACKRFGLEGGVVMVGEESGDSCVAPDSYIPLHRQKLAACALISL
jgi:hypothetical protein